MMVPIQVIRWYRMQCYDGTDSCAIVVPIRRYCQMNNPIYNARLQKWFKRNADLQCSNVVSLPDCIGDIAIPTTAFNVIYQLTHLYHHFFDEGIGMRQIIDYFFVVNDFSKNVFLDTDFSNHTVPLSKEGSTFSPSPSSSGSGDVAGDAIALPEFW